MKKRVYDYIHKHDLVQAGANVLVGVSGGADSVCLLLLLNEWTREHDARVVAVHVNHGIRGGEALRDQKFVEELCRRLGVELHVQAVNVPELATLTGMSLEEAGREARYNAFSTLAAETGCTRIAVAHHMDDAAETVLMNIMRGTGVEGLAGLRPRREMSEGTLQSSGDRSGAAEKLLLIRPLLCVSKDEILDFLKSEGQEWCEDSTNAEADVTRNRVRLELLPLMESIRPGAADGILRMAGLAAETSDFMSEMAETEFEKALVEEEGVSGNETLTLDTSVLRDTHPALMANVIRTAIVRTRGDVQDITRKHMEMVKALIERADDAASHLPGLLVSRKGNSLVFEAASREEKIAASSCAAKQVSNRETFSLKCSVHEVFEHDLFKQNPYTIVCDYDKITHTVELRGRREGDYITLANGGKKLLRRWLIDEKIPREDRDDIQVAADGSHIIWIVGRRFNEYYKVEPTTKRILVMEFGER